MYLWDSNILHAFGDGHATVRRHIDKVGWEKIALPSVVVSEVLRGRIEFTLKADTGAQLAQANRLFMETYMLLFSSVFLLIKLFFLKEKFGCKASIC
ncbi:type II toxin-antitoxin system VapC family toxin [Candidatus Poribacteria bacterium]|nr:type II toxin-antitoxin system VapC family toxin [Candidatus Poribacteria bacterium]